MVTVLGSSRAVEAQQAAGALRCPSCGGALSPVEVDGHPESSAG